MRFPDLDVMAESRHWDQVTAGVVLRRIGPPPPLRFFTTDEEPVARALLDRLLAQESEPRIPLLELLDSRLLERETDGWRYEDMPEDGQAWHRTIQHLDEDALTFYGGRFHSLNLKFQDALIESVRVGDDWHGLWAPHVWSLWTRYACTAFYSHPWAWNEIGFGGPAYPRGYANLGLNGVEHWESSDRGER
ncbi:MAG: gluconate 2-dehydrogenase subunit 3 family protein [Microthrixaceae bacterium]